MRIGVDLGGTKIEILALGDDGTERFRQRIPTPAGSYRDTVAAVVSLVWSVEQALGGRASVGVGTPGAISPASGLIKNANSTCLNGHALDRDLSDALGRTVRVANDANCMALSEAVDGAATGAGCVFGVIIGTGVGGGVVVDGRVLRGPNAIAGEWGHNPLPLPDAEDLPLPPCYCGRLGCIETWLSGPGLVADHLRHGGVETDAAQIAAAGNPACEASMQRYERRLARSLAGVINILDPDVVVLAGGLSNVARLYANVPRLWTQHVFSDRVDTRLVKSLHGDASGVRGAAWLWPLGQGS